MNPSHVSTQHTKLESLSYPGVCQRMVEAVMGSVRRDALAILRGATRAELEPGKSNPSVQFTHDNGVVRFTFGPGLEAVHINTPRGSLHLSGSCEMAQRLSRFAIRALGVHHARAKNACVKDVMSLLAGDDHGQALSSSYDASQCHEHHGDGYASGKTERGSITTEHGVLTLSSEQRLYRIGGQMGLQMDLNHHSAVLALEQRKKLSSPYDSVSTMGSGWTMGSGLSPLEDIPIPLPSAGEIDWAEATFSNAQFAAMLKLMGIPEGLDQVDFDSQTVRSLLAWAKRAKENH